MIEKENIKRKLKHERNRIDELLNKLENEENQIFSEEYFDFLRYRFYPFHNELILEKLDQINERLKNQSFQCRLTDETDGIMKMLVAPRHGQNEIQEMRNKGLKEIRDFTRDSEELIIIDPYIFGGSTDSASQYIEEFQRCSRCDAPSLKKIHIIYSSNHGNTKAIKDGIKKIVSQKCKITNHDTEKIHDRIWIKNKTEAIVVGTSFGTIGNRLCFILELPQYDLKALLEYLESENCYSQKFS